MLKLDQGKLVISLILSLFLVIFLSKKYIIQFKLQKMTYYNVAKLIYFLFIIFFFYYYFDFTVKHYHYNKNLGTCIVYIRLDVMVYHRQHYIILQLGYFTLTGYS